MRIGVNTLPLFPGQIGGMETYTVNLLTHLAAIDRQHTYYLFVARYNRALFEAQCQHPNVAKVQTLHPRGRGVAVLLIDPHDPGAIADAIHQILTDEELRHRLIRAGRERCRHFSWERTARETRKVLEEAADHDVPWVQ